MDDFFKSMKDQLENRPEPEFEEGAWTDLNRRLEASGQNRTVSRRYWYTAALLLLLLGSTLCNFWFYRQLKASGEPQVREVRLLQTDTIHHTRHIYHTDTVVDTRLVYLPARQQQPATQDAAFYAALRSMDVRNLEQRFAMSGNNSYRSVPGAAVFSSGNTVAPVEDDLSVLNRFTLFYGLPQAVAELESPERESPDTEVDMIAKVQHKKSFTRRMLYAMKPKRVFLGPTIGAAYPVHSDLKNQRGISAGIQAAVSFSDNFRLWAEATFLRLTYTTSQIQSLRGVPPITPPSDNFDFVSASVPQPALQYSAGFQYSFKNNASWNPYLAAGLSTLTLFPFQVTYKFEDLLNDLELTIEQGVDRKTQFSQHAIFKAGLDNRLSDRWSMQFEALYRLSLDPEGATNTNLLGLRVGTMYRF